MAEENENTDIEETPDAERVEAEAVVEETAPESEPAAEAQPVAEAESEPVSDEPAAEGAATETEHVAEAEPVAAEAEAEPVADEPTAAEEPVAEAEPVVAEAEVEPATDETEAAPADAAPTGDASDAPAAGVSGPKPKRKRLPRSERPKKTRPKRVASAERKPITRLPKPEHERGRRQERQGVVVSDAADKTIVVRVDVVKVHPRYKKVVKRSTRFHAHDEENQAKLGDVVKIVETRPLSRLKRWRLHEIVEAAK